MRKRSFAVLVLFMAFVMATPVVAFARTLGSAVDFTDLHPLGAEQLEEMAATGEAIAEAIDSRTVALTPEAREIALADFEYLANFIIQAAPTQNIVVRRGIAPSIEMFFC